MPANHLPLRIGADSTGKNAFVGNIARARIFSRALSPEEIGLLAGGKPGGIVHLPGIVADWALGDLVNGVCPSSVGPGLTAKAVGAVTVVEAGGVRATHLEGGSFLEVADDPRLNPGVDCTLDAWIQPGELSQDGARIIDKCTPGTADGFTFDTYPGRSLRLLAGSVSAAYDAKMAPGAWVHVAAVIDEDGNASLYLAGRRVAPPAPPTRASWCSDALRYEVDGTTIVGRNGPYYNNRPLYCPHGPAAILAGDRPLLRFIEADQVYGTFSVALVRDGKGIWLDRCANVEMRYRCGRCTWRIADPALSGVKVVWDAVPLDGVPGFAARIRVDGAQEGDRLIWVFGGAHAQGNALWAWDPVLAPQTEAWSTSLSAVLQRGAEPANARDNRVVIDGDVFRAAPAQGRGVIGRCSIPCELVVADGRAYDSPETLAAAPAASLPLVCGTVALHAGPKELFWAVEAPRDVITTGSPRVAAPEDAFKAGAAYMDGIERRVVVETPDAYLNAAVSAVGHAIDAVFYPPVFRHGCMAWNNPYPGWRTTFGGTVMGWHDRIVQEAAYYTAAQVKVGGGVEPHSDPDRRLSVEAADSRFYGRGRIRRDDGMYDFQSQFFDQMIHAWRWTGDSAMERLLRGSLALHEEWATTCFDPDGDGLYESAINTWPTDSVWYNGGGCVEESAYIYTVCRALSEMAQHDGDLAAAARYKERAEKIRAAVHDLLWDTVEGHFDSYKEQGGHQRVHTDAWLYSEFLPVDAGMTSLEETLQALYYTEWGLERIKTPFGGVKCHTSNWVPSTWSVRELWQGDNYHLALAYFQAGLGDEGYDLLRGNLLDYAFGRVVPGGLAQAEGGTDFTDITSPFCRAVVEGLFGFYPDYPNGRVCLRPAFPTSWPKASITTPDYSLSFRREEESDRYRLTLAQTAALHFRIPVRMTAVRRVLLDGREVLWTMEPGVNCTLVLVDAARTMAAELVIEGSRLSSSVVPAEWTGKAGDPVKLKVGSGKITAIEDLHSALTGARHSATSVTGRLANKPGHHMVMVQVLNGTLPQWQLFKLHIEDPAGEARRADQTPRTAPLNAHWACLDLSPQLNGDIRTIYQQKYLSPRPKTCSVRIGVDGYSPWTFSFWGVNPPLIDLSHLAKLTDGEGRIGTPAHVPFLRFSESKNIAFTSLWDNWPREVTIPVKRQAGAVWMLVCGTTNPMQTRIANAEIRFRYSDGQVEKLELVPPLNFWTLCPLNGRDYFYARDSFCLPKDPPPTVQLGSNCRAMVLSWKLRPGVELEDMTLETLSQEVVVGLMGVSLMNPR